LCSTSGGRAGATAAMAMMGWGGSLYGVASSRRSDKSGTQGFKKHPGRVIGRVSDGISRRGTLDAVSAGPHRRSCRTGGRDCDRNRGLGDIPLQRGTRGESPTKGPVAECGQRTGMTASWAVLSIFERHPGRSVQGRVVERVEVPWRLVVGLQAWRVGARPPNSR
jgi:hypothetical protein